VTQILFLLRSDTKSHIEVKVEPIFFSFSQTMITAVARKFAICGKVGGARQGFEEMGRSQNGDRYVIKM
jgi:hypothetical protein